MPSYFNQKYPIIQSAERLTAIDALRGFVMLLMALDHASFTFNAGCFARDGKPETIGAFLVTGAGPS